MINEQKFYLKDVQFSGQDKILSYQDLSSQIHSLNNLLFVNSSRVNMCLAVNLFLKKLKKKKKEKKEKKKEKEKEIKQYST